MTFYRYCAGTAFSNPSSATRVLCKTSGSNVGLSLSLVAVKELRTVCDTLSGQCTGKNQPRSGDGIEMLVYKDTVDFRTSKYNGLIKSGCTELRFDVGICCRNSSITTGSANYTLYNFADLSLKTGFQNSSPEFAFDPVPRFICNQPVYYSFAAIDTVDGDSLSYAIVQPMSTSTNTLSANYPPFTVYYPATLRFPYSNPNANPPIGFYFDDETGAIIFTPTKCDEITTMVLQVSEWRKDSSGKYQKIGVVRRDMMHEVKTGKGNNPPYLSATRSYTVCEGDSLTVTFSTGDKVKVPPPPLPTPDPDSVKVRWNYGIPGGHFSIVDSSALNQKGRFTWRPALGQSRSNPYQFDIAIKDNNCPSSASSFYPVRVKVLPRASATIQLDSLACGQYIVSSIIDTLKTNIPKYYWEVLDTNGDVLYNSRAPIFSSTKSFISIKQTDTIRFQHKGRYIIRHRIDNAQRCPSYSYDTLDIPDLLEVRFSNDVDTFVCQGTTKDFTANVLNGSGLVTYLWSTNDTTQQISYSLADSVSMDQISVIATDTNGCYATSAIRVMNRPRPTIDAISDQTICKGDSIYIQPKGTLALWDDPRDKDTTLYQQGSILDYSLYNKSKWLATDTGFNIKQTSSYQLVVSDSLACTDTAAFVVKWPSGKGLKPLNLCNIKGGTVDLRQYEDAKDSGGIWYCPAYKKVVKNEKVLVVDSFEVTDYSIANTIYYSYKHLGNGCELLDSLKVTVHPIPALKMQDLTICQRDESLDVIDDSVILSPSASILSHGSQQWTCIDCKSYDIRNLIQDINAGKPGEPEDYQIYIDDFTIPLGTKSQESLSFAMEFTDSNGCTAQQSTTITVTKPPNINVSGFPDLCWDAGEIDLHKLSNVTPNTGYWKAIDKTGYADASDINKAIVGGVSDTLKTTLSKKPATSSLLKYSLRYHVQSPGCLATFDTSLIIRGLPNPVMARSVFQVHSSKQPFPFCTSQEDIELSANYAGGSFSSTIPLALVGNVFKPSKVTKLNTPFKLFYDYTDIYGCSGADSVQVVVESPNELSVSPMDTAHTWYADNMVQWLHANPRFGYGVRWEALDGGTFDNDTAKSTRYTFQTNKEVTSMVRVKATATQATNACGPETNEVNILVHRTPCIDFNMELDLTTKVLKLTPSVDSFPQYQWAVGDSLSFEQNATFNVAKYGDKIINVQLRTHNKAGDDCYTDKRINLKNGSVNVMDNHGVRIYPNPVLDGFNMEVDGDKKIDKMSVFNSLGSEVLNSVNPENYVDCSGLPAGVYSVLISCGSETYVLKFIKG